MPTSKVVKILEQDLSDILKRFFTSFKLSHDQTFESISLFNKS